MLSPAPSAGVRSREFDSYSHALDGALVLALETGLERFANPGLWTSIEEALAASASPIARRARDGVLVPLQEGVT